MTTQSPGCLSPRWYMWQRTNLFRHGYLQTLHNIDWSSRINVAFTATYYHLIEHGYLQTLQDRLAWGIIIAFTATCYIVTCQLNLFNYHRTLTTQRHSIPSLDVYTPTLLLVNMVQSQQTNTELLPQLQDNVNSIHWTRTHQDFTKTKACIPFHFGLALTTISQHPYKPPGPSLSLDSIRYTDLPIH